MKMLFILPANTPKTTGNWVTAQRLQMGLEKLGYLIYVTEADQVTTQLISQVDLVHCFHSYKSGLVIQDLLISSGVPYVVSFTGTDLEGLKKGKLKEQVLSFLQMAELIIVFHQEAATDAVAGGVPEASLQVINQAALPSSLATKEGKLLRTQWGINPEQVVFLLAGGIRPVKGVLEAIQLMEPVAKSNPQALLILVGPVLNHQLGEEMFTKLDQLSWATYRGEIPHQQMASVIAAADVVINTSFSEGMPNTLLEGLTQQKPLLARNVSGNRAIVCHGINGYLFTTPNDFSQSALKLAGDVTLRRQLGHRSDNSHPANSWEKEIASYHATYQSILDRSKEDGENTNHSGKT